MKRLILTATLGLLAADVGWCTISTYTNKSYVTTVPLTPIDATNFVNLNMFYFGTSWPYDFSNVRNYTNRHYMSNPSSGFRFDTVPTVGNRYMAQSFYNAALAPNSYTNATVHGGYQLFISATNIVNRGILSASSFGLIKLEGQNLDLSRGAFQVGMFTDREPLTPEAVFDMQWGLDAVVMTPDGLVTSNSPSTPGYRVVQFSPQSVTSPYANAQTALTLTETAGSVVSSAQYIIEAETNRTVQYVFLRTANTNSIQAEIRFRPNPNQNPPPASAQIPVIEWRTLGTNAFGQVYTNTLYLSDSFGILGDDVALLENYPFASQPPQSAPIPPATYQPTNFIVNRTLAEWTSLTAADPFVEPDPTIWTTNDRPERVTANYSGYAFTLAATTLDPSQISQQAITNIRTGPGRIELKASGKLDLNLARIDGLNYLRIDATNHFAGASNATMFASYADLNLGSTNGMLDTSGLLSSSLSRLIGTVYCFSAKWENVVYYENGETNVADFHVLYVDSSLQNSSPTETISLALHSTNAFVSDPVTVLDKLDLDVMNLTIRDNGSIQVYPTDLHWANSAPRLVTLTNNGLINFLSSYDEMGFYGLDSMGNPVPYRDFVNNGYIYNNGSYVLATNIVNSGYLYSTYGPMTLQALGDLTLAQGGILQVPNADLTLNCRNLYVTNHFIGGGRSLRMSITGDLRAGFNFWTVYDGFHLLTKPATGDFSATTITDIGYEFAEVFHTWAGEDRGASAAGFTDNAALGQLDLDGGLHTLFTFNGSGPISNALYVDVLVLRGGATNRDAGGNLTAIQVNPGMKIYFSQAFIDDGMTLTDVTSELAGVNGGSLVQVSHSGPLSMARPVVSLTPALRVTIEKVPSLRSLVTWDTAPSATNYLYRIANPYGSNWQLVTNFVSGPTAGPVTVAEPVDDSSRFYKVRVDVKP